jgi:hypothetical protein
MKADQLENRLLSREAMVQQRAEVEPPSYAHIPLLPGTPTAVQVSWYTQQVQDCLREASTPLNALDRARWLLRQESFLFDPIACAVCVQGAQQLIKKARHLHLRRTFRVAIGRTHARATYEKPRRKYLFSDKSPRGYCGVVVTEDGLLWKTFRTYPHRQSAARAASKRLSTLLDFTRNAT